MHIAYESIEDSDKPADAQSCNSLVCTHKELERREVNKDLDQQILPYICGVVMGMIS